MIESMREVFSRVGEKVCLPTSFMSARLVSGNSPGASIVQASL